MDKNLVSVIIATKNGGKFLSRSVSSIEKQSEKSIEVVIVSDGSTDDTVSIAKKLAENRPFIKIIDLQNNIGPGLARNAGIKAASGKYIALLDDDDEWLDFEKIKLQKDFLDRNLEYVLIGAAETDFVNEDGKILFTYKPKIVDTEIRSNILRSNQFVTSSVMFRKDVFEKIGGFAKMYLAEDYELWLRMAKQGKVANLSGCKTRYYKRQSGAALSNKKKLNKAVLDLVKKNRRDFPNSFLAIIAAYTRVLLG